MFILTTILVTFLGCYAEDAKRVFLPDPQIGIVARLQSLTSRIDTLEMKHQADISKLESTYRNNISRLESENLALYSALQLLT